MNSIHHHHPAVNDGPQPDPDGGYVVLVNGIEIEMAWADDPGQADRSYHGLARRPILWTVNGQTRFLEVAQ